jgi:predicted dehydrogenase
VYHPPTTKFAVIGFGHIGRRHAAIIQEHAACELVALCDVRPKAELTDIDKFEAPFYESLAQLLEQQPDAEVINICTPNGLHARQALQALDAGRHVVIEKPMALRRADCERINRRAREVGRQVFCVMQNRYSPSVRWLKETVDAGLLGDIRLLQINCFWNRDDRYYRPGGEPHPWRGTPGLDGGTLFTQFAHFIDILYWIFGDIEVLDARLRNFAHTHSTDFEDAGAVHFRLLRGGGLGSLLFSTALWDRNFESAITAIGSRGTVKIGGQYMDRIDYCYGEDLRLPSLPATNAPNTYTGYQGSAANHHFVIQNVIDTLRGDGQVTTSGIEGMKVVEIIERIYDRGDGR